MDRVHTELPVIEDADVNRAPRTWEAPFMLNPNDLPIFARLTARIALFVGSIRSRSAGQPSIFSQPHAKLTRT